MSVWLVLFSIPTSTVRAIPLPAPCSRLAEQALIFPLVGGWTESGPSASRLRRDGFAALQKSGQAILYWHAYWLVGVGGSASIWLYFWRTRPMETNATAVCDDPFLHQALWPALLDKVSSKFSKGGKIRLLDLGTGTGEVMRHARERFSASGLNADIYGVDVSPEALQFAPKHAHAAVMSYEQLGFSPKSFDLVTSNLSVGYSDDPKKVFMEVHRVLKRHGLFVLVEHHEHSQITRGSAGLIPYLEKLMDHLGRVDFALGTDRRSFVYALGSLLNSIFLEVPFVPYNLANNVRQIPEQLFGDNLEPIQQVEWDRFKESITGWLKMLRSQESASRTFQDAYQSRWKAFMEACGFRVLIYEGYPKETNLSNYWVIILEKNAEPDLGRVQSTFRALSEFRAGYRPPLQKHQVVAVHGLLLQGMLGLDSTLSRLAAGVKMQEYSLQIRTGYFFDVLIDAPQKQVTVYVPFLVRDPNSMASIMRVAANLVFRANEPYIFGVLESESEMHTKTLKDELLKLMDAEQAFDAALRQVLGEQLGLKNVQAMFLDPFIRDGNVEGLLLRVWIVPGAYPHFLRVALQQGRIVLKKMSLEEAKTALLQLKSRMIELYWREHSVRRALMECLVTAFPEDEKRIEDILEQLETLDPNAWMAALGNILMKLARLKTPEEIQVELLGFERINSPVAQCARFLHFLSPEAASRSNPMLTYIFASIGQAFDRIQPLGSQSDGGFQHHLLRQKPALPSPVAAAA